MFVLIALTAYLAGILTTLYHTIFVIKQRDTVSMLPLSGQLIAALPVIALLLKAINYFWLNTPAIEVAIAAILLLFVGLVYGLKSHFKRQSLIYRKMLLQTANAYCIIIAILVISKYM